MPRKSKLVKPKVVPPVAEDLLTLHVLYSQSESGGGHTSSERYSRREDRHTSTSFKGAVISPKGERPTQTNSWDSNSFDVPKAAFETPRAHVYAVVGYYSDGDTFGSSYGNMHIVDVYGNLEKANAVAQVLRLEDKEKNQSIFGSKRYVPWGGYFSRLESIEVEVLSVLVTHVDTDSSVGTGKDPNDLPSW